MYCVWLRHLQNWLHLHWKRMLWAGEEPLGQVQARRSSFANSATRLQNGRSSVGSIAQWVRKIRLLLPLNSQEWCGCWCFSCFLQRGNTQASGKCCSSIWPCLDFSTHSKNITPIGRSQGNSKYTRNNINKGSMDVWKNCSRGSCKVKQQRWGAG